MKRALRAAFVVPAFVVGIAGIGHAQDTARVVQGSIRAGEPDVDKPVIGGLAFGAMGFVAGGYLLASRDSCRGDDGCLESAFFGAAVGGTVGMAIGVHLGNRRRGNVWIDALAGATVWTTGMMIGRALHWRGETALYVLTAIPIAQMITMINVERAAGRAKDRSEGVAIGFVPTRYGAAISVRVPLPRGY
jgi:hypothetical protein